MDLLSFSTGYTAQDQNQISFNWNGKHANEFFDSNQQFRRNIISFVIENDQLYFPVDLIRDLFLEEAKWSVQAWSVGYDFNILGEKLIRYGKDKFLNDFLIGAFSSFDTYCSSRMMHLERFEVESVLEELKKRLKDPECKDYKDKYDSGIELFESYLEGNQREGLFQITGDIQVTNIRVVKPSKIKNMIRTVYKKIKRNL
ncbi:hypothetical protein A7K91_15070 [Paenibacillus oryzae]|uniref:Uncharacterized protein n=1 Tax=Paenibacillus oryzae TaxID=1844972 RepID=A0A1A5YTI5_9BACL|nr:hypothetical protein [Paenibacillus oryzae]OBR68946.1 hypothetical protein A7K91_15070 [Paenibacillus oryzae]